MRLKCVSDYRSDAGEWKKGQAVDVSESIAEFLLRDSPGSFKVEKEDEGDVPKVDRQQRGGRTR